MFQNKNRVLIDIVVSAFIISLLGCSKGGGTGDTNNPPAVVIEDNNTDKINNPPVAVIEDTTSIIEGMSIELNASKSYDIDGDNISYKWVQTSGESVTLLNDDTSTPSFIAPEVNSDSNITLELSLSDGTDSTKDKKLIFITNQEKIEKRHEVMPTTTTISTTNGSVDINYTYNKNPINESTSGLVLNIFWDSTKLEFIDIKKPFENDYIGIGTIKEDVDNSDSSETTDRYITISWVNLADGNWIVPTLPTKLFILNMKSKVIKGTTEINLATKVDSPSLAFYSKSVIVQLEE